VSSTICIRGESRKKEEEKGIRTSYTFLEEKQTQKGDHHERKKETSSLEEGGKRRTATGPLFFCVGRGKVNHSSFANSAGRQGGRSHAPAEGRGGEEKRREELFVFLTGVEGRGGQTPKKRFIHRSFLGRTKKGRVSSYVGEKGKASKVPDGPFVVEKTLSEKKRRQIEGWEGGKKKD